MCVSSVWCVEYQCREEEIKINKQTKKKNYKKSTDSKSILSNSAEQDQNNWFAHYLFISGDDFSFSFLTSVYTFFKD